MHQCHRNGETCRLTDQQRQRKVSCENDSVCLTHLYKLFYRMESAAVTLKCGVSRGAAHHTTSGCRVALNYRFEKGVRVKDDVFETNVYVIPKNYGCKKELEICVGNVPNCIYVIGYTVCVLNCNGSEETRRRRSLYGFFMLLLESVAANGVEFATVQYCEDIDFHDLTTTVALLHMYGYVEDGNYKALPFKRFIDQAMRKSVNSYIKNSGGKRFLDIMGNAKDRRWCWVQNMFRQVLNYLAQKMEEMSDEQNELFALAKEAWNYETDGAPLNEHYNGRKNKVTV